MGEELRLSIKKPRHRLIESFTMDLGHLLGVRGVEQVHFVTVFPIELLVWRDPSEKGLCLYRLRCKTTFAVDFSQHHHLEVRPERMQ